MRNRQTIRLRGYDYSSPGAYFITICVQNRECIFGKIIDGKMIVNNAGKMVQTIWRKIPEYFPNVILDKFITMPNHIHGILFIKNFCRGAIYRALPIYRTTPRRNNSKPNTINSINIINCAKKFNTPINNINDNPLKFGRIINPRNE